MGDVPRRTHALGLDRRTVRRVRYDSNRDHHFYVLIWFGGNTLLFVGFGVAYHAGVIAWIGLRFGFDATRDDIVEDLTGAEPGELDDFIARDLVERMDRADRNVVR
ncbi:MAG: hypothetical protein L3K19_04415 [Thermoplasmata archaeon]|nr:hypothetical protein [Thermoplasmata archaeon]